MSLRLVPCNAGFAGQTRALVVAIVGVLPSACTGGCTANPAADDADVGRDGSQTSDARDTAYHADTGSTAMDASLAAEQASDAFEETDSVASGCKLVLASDYDQACNTDDDCVFVPEVTACPPNCAADCPQWVINKASMEQYATALSQAIAGAVLQCHCPGLPVFSCCRGGVCQSLCSD